MIKWRYESETETIRTIPENYCVAALDIEAATIQGKNGPLIAAAPFQHEAHKQIYDWAHKALNGGLKRPGRPVKISDYKQVLNLIRGEARDAIAKAEGN